MDIEVIRKQITDTTALIVFAITLVLNAIAGIVLQFANAKKLVVQQLDCFSKK